MVDRDTLTPGDGWPGYYRGYTLSVAPSREVWWQVYQGTERLYIDPVPDAIVDRLLEVKRNGGRFHVTEEGDALTKVESGDEYDSVWLGSVELEGVFQPAENPKKTVPVRPDGLESGDLWPSVYDGARFSQVSADNVWWSNPKTHHRHPIGDPLPDDVAEPLQRFKPRGGSFRVTPWGDLITLVPSHPVPDRVQEQFGDLPSVVRSIISLRREEVGLEMLPIYVGNVADYKFDIQEPRTLSEPLSSEEEAELEAWATSLGETSDRSAADHRADRGQDSEPGTTRDPDKDFQFDDDPDSWDHE